MRNSRAVKVCMAERMMLFSTAAMLHNFPQTDTAWYCIYLVMGDKWAVVGFATLNDHWPPSGSQTNICLRLWMMITISFLCLQNAAAELGTVYCCLCQSKSVVVKPRLNLLYLWPSVHGCSVTVSVCSERRRHTNIVQVVCLREIPLRAQFIILFSWFLVQVYPKIPNA